MLSYTVPAASEDEAEAYFTASGEVWAGDAGTLMRGQRYVAANYNSRWLVAFDNGAAPDAVKHAIFEAARREAATPGSLAPDYQPAQAVKREKVDVLEVEYIDPVPVAGLPALLDGLLAAIARPTKSRTQTAYVVRA